MTDKELLVAAAMAAGWTYHQAGELDTRTSVGGWIDAEGDVYWEDLWNPLTNDGDALRLAVKLKMDVKQWESNSIAVVVWDKHATEDATKDRYAATRRAIVRAAAEIGSSHNAAADPR